MDSNICSKIIINYIAGSLSGLIEVLLTHPIDLIKTKMQESRLNNEITCIRSTMINIYQTKGFYKGVVPRLCGIVPMRLVFWGTQNTINNYILKTRDDRFERLLKLTFSGTVGGFAQTLVDNPIEFLKIRQMTNNKNPYYVKDMFRTGFSATVIRNIQFAVCVNIGINFKDNTLYEKFIYGAMGGFIGGIITQPIDIVKTEFQRHNNKHAYRTVWEMIKKKPKTLWVGILPRSVLGFCTMGIGVVSIHKISKVLENII